ncbi:MAG: caspase family protein [Thiomargarita sp.]|nr:caspase family protein [Thiomargarita sp.]
MIRFFLLQIFFVFLFFINIQPLSAADSYCRIEGKRLRISKKTLGVALVIGNSAYKSKELKHPVNDANDIASLLRSIGFSVYFKKNIKTEQEFKTIINDFIHCLKKDEKLVAFFYFSGYGKYVDTTGETVKNYLLPTNDNKITDEIAVEEEAYSVRSLFRNLGKNLPKNRKVFILDACRQYPKFSLGDGLAEMKVEYINNYLVSFPTIISKVNDEGIRLASQTIISDQWGTRNSLYVEHLLRALKEVKTETKRIEDVFSEINEAIGEDERNKGNVEWIKGAYFYPNPVSLKPLFCFGKTCPTEGIDSSKKYKPPEPPKNTRTPVTVEPLPSKRNVPQMFIIHGH